MVAVYALKTGGEQDNMPQGCLSETLVRYVAVRHGVNIEDIVFDRTAEGKPFLRDAPGFQYNLSHSGEWIACAVHAEPVGIDIEQVLPIDILQYREHLSLAEYYALRALPPKEQESHFYELWTLKESYLKQRGIGLSVAMSSFTIQQHNGNYILLGETGARQEGIFFRQYAIDESYKMAVCAEENLFDDVMLLTIADVRNGGD